LSQESGDLTRGQPTNLGFYLRMRKKITNEMVWKYFNFVKLNQMKFIAILHRRKGQNKTKNQPPLEM